MKHYLSIIALISFTILPAQISGEVNAGAAGRSREILNLTNGNKFGTTMTFFNPKRKVVGSVHLFKDWNNKGIIVTNDNQQFLVRNININIERNVFEAKVEGEESVFTFNFNNIDRFIVNGKPYKNFYYNDDNRVYELIYESEDFILMKGFKAEMVEGSANPMVNRKYDRWKQTSSYFVMSDNKIKPFKLKKSRILKLVDGDVERANKIEAYIKKNKLSYKKEMHIKQALEFTAKN